MEHGNILVVYPFKLLKTLLHTQMRRDEMFYCRPLLSFLATTAERQQFYVLNKEDPFSELTIKLEMGQEAV